MRRRAFAVAVAALLAFPGRSSRADERPWADAVYAAAARHGVSGEWLLATMLCESGGDPGADNPRTGDCGLYQFAPATWAEFSGYRGIVAPDIWSPSEQIEMAAWAFAAGYACRWCCSGCCGEPWACR